MNRIRLLSCFQGYKFPFSFFFCLAASLSCFSSVQGNMIVEKPMVVVVPSYNNEKWFEANLHSIFMQKYSNYRVIYLNDCSGDATGRNVEDLIQKEGIDHQIIDFDDHESDDIEAVVKSFVRSINRENHFFTLIHNVHRCGALANLYRAIHSCREDRIIVTLDGDDQFYHEEVLKNLNSVYTSGNIWFTHGTLIEHPGNNVTWCEPIPQEIIKNGGYRTFKCPSHLRTFYTWLFKKIKLEDLLWKGKFIPMAWDMAIMYPISEMAEERHAFITEVNYIYNMENSLNDNKVDPQLQNDLDRFIRNKSPYSRIEK